MPDWQSEEFTSSPSWGGQIAERVGRWNRTRYEQRLAIMHKLAEEAQAEMKVRAPWQNHTWNARNTLEAKVEATPWFPRGARHVITIQFKHGMWYGLFLEKSNQGRFAIVGPTFQRYKPIIRRALRSPGRAV